MTPDEARIVAETEARIVAYLSRAADEATSKMRRATHPLSQRNWAAVATAAGHFRDAIQAGDHRKDTNGR